MNTIQTVVDRLNLLGNKNNSRGYETTFTTTKGRKYTKVIESSGGVHCFIDDDGNIFKPASWSAPAKGVRATLETLNLDSIDQHGSWLYR
jgi:hypothetical protein